MLITFKFVVISLLFLILIVLVFPKEIKNDVNNRLINPLNYSQEKNNVYTYLDHKIFIQNPEILKFIDSIIYYIDVSPPLFLQFIDELNLFYKNIWILNKLMIGNSVRSINNQTTTIMYEYNILINKFNEFKMTMPPDLLPQFNAQQIVFETIIKEQMEYVCNKVNHFNFNNKCLTRYSTKDLENTSYKQSKLLEGEFVV